MMLVILMLMLVMMTVMTKSRNNQRNLKVFLLIHLSAVLLEHLKQIIFLDCVLSLYFLLENHE